MKIVLYVIPGLAFLIGVSLVMLSLQSRTPPASLGLAGGQLRPCPATPNCVSSQAQDDAARVPPLRYTGSADQAWRNLREVVVARGGRIVTQQENYLHATFVTPLLRFVDDVEFLLDTPAGVIQVRSASRVGRSDFGVNRKRVEAIRAGLNNAMAGQPDAPALR